MTRVRILINALIAGINASINGRAFSVGESHTPSTAAPSTAAPNINCVACNTLTYGSRNRDECNTCMAGTNKCWTLNEQFNFYFCAEAPSGVDFDVNPVTASSCDELNWCNGNGQCAMTGPDSAICICNSLYTGDNCANAKPISNQKSCSDLNYCNNHGRCFSKPSADAYCDCNVGWQGASCNIPIQAGSVTCRDLNYCGAHGKCIQTPQDTDDYCSCDSGWKGIMCDQAQAFNYLQCGEDLICSTNGRCIDRSSADDYCVCNEGWSGKTCNVQDSCGNVGICQNGAACVYDAQRYGNYCACRDGYFGPTCASRDPCVETKCYNDGVCNNINGEAQCSCAPGWKGPYCEVMIPCTRKCGRGWCTHGVNSMSCKCPDGVYGSNCQEDCQSKCNLSTHECKMENQVAICTEKRKSICNALSPCQNGCECADGDHDGYDYTCTNKQGRYFLGKRCNFDEPQLNCASDHITVTVTNDLLLRHIFKSDAKFATGTDNQLEFSDGGALSTLRIERKDFSKISAPAVENGVLTFGSSVRSLRTFEGTTPVVTTIFSFQCQYGVDLTPATITPLEWPKISVEADQATFEVEMKFFSVDARAGIHRRARSSPVLLVREEIFVNLAPTANSFDQFPELGSQTGIRVKNCYLVAGNTQTPIIEDGVALESSGHAHASFDTPQPATGVEFSLILLNTHLRDSTLQCTAALCTGDACKHTARVGRSIQNSSTNFSMAIGPFMLADLSDGTQSNLSTL